RLLFLDRVVDLIEEGLDIGVRIAHLPDSSLSASRVGSVRRVVCASPDYLARHGKPRAPGDLAHFDAITGTISSEDWQFGAPPNVVTVRPPSRLIVSNADLA